jgi:hypothetical protein
MMLGYAQGLVKVLICEVGVWMRWLRHKEGVTSMG